MTFSDIMKFINENPAAKEMIQTCIRTDANITKNDILEVLKDCMSDDFGTLTMVAYSGKELSKELASKYITRFMAFLYLAGQIDKLDPESIFMKFSQE